MSVSSLFTVFRLLTGRTAAMGSRDVLLLLGLGLYLAVVLRFITTSTEVDAVFEDILKIIHKLSGGRV